MKPPSSHRSSIALGALFLFLPGCGGAVSGGPGDGGARTAEAGVTDGASVPPDAGTAAEDSAGSTPEGAAGAGPDSYVGLVDASGPDATAQSAAGDSSVADTDVADGWPGPSGSVYVVATVAPGALSTNGNAECMFAQQISFVIVGTPTAPVPTTVADGHTQGGQPVHVACSVVAAAGGYDVKASVSMEGGGSLTIAGHVTTSGASDTSAVFTSGYVGTFSEASGCTVTYTGDPPPQSPAVAPGRIWGHIDCESASLTAEPGPNPGGAPLAARTCDAYADFLFEGCGS